MSPESPIITFVTQNTNKVADARRLLPDFDLRHIDFVVPEIQSMELEEIAQYKVRYAYERAHTPCFVMDASLELDCLNGFPGPFVKWYFTNTVGAEKTCSIAKLFNQPECRWRTVLSYFDGSTVTNFHEQVEGLIADTPRGTQGYDWDVIFIPKGESRTFAEMTFDEKQRFALTRRLLEQFAAFLRSPLQGA